MTDRAARAQTILVIDDEPQIRRVVRNAFDGDGVRVVEAGTGAEGVDLAAAERPTLIILDLGLPDRGGRDVCRDLRAFTDVPIIVLSARQQEAEKIGALDAGADDYVTKPFSTAELQARARAQLRRSMPRDTEGGARVTIGDLTVDLAGRVVTKAGEYVHLTPTEWELLKTFVTHADQTLTHRQLFAAVWGQAHGDAQQYLRVYVGQLRRKIEDDPVRPRYIKTESGVGYRLQTGG
jgi:two-component system, OmpR family, KDP operon response regulator KdpE